MTATNADPALVARYDALGKLPQNTFGKALWDFDKRNGYPFPGDPTALNAAFGTAHDSTHVISDYDTSARGELLVSTFTAGMHPINPMSGHILPVIFFFHFGEQLNDVGHAGTGGLDPDEFWHAWARGAEMTVDIFDPKWNVWDWVETRPRGPAARVERHAGRPDALTVSLCRRACCGRARTSVWLRPPASPGPPGPATCPCDRGGKRSHRRQQGPQRPEPRRATSCARPPGSRRRRR